jgi:hypothetical protein
MEPRAAGRQEPAPDTLVVFSHPNHEVAIFGLLQRWRPAILYLTDGGGAGRVAETEQGLRSIGLLDRATFLNRPEASFYRALLDVDHAFFRDVADRVAEAVDRWQPRRVLCDAVEYYNPVHDLSLPLVVRGLAASTHGGRGGVEVFEIPLIRQVPSGGREEYAVQRPTPSRAGSQMRVTLTAEELAAKLAARDQVYTILAAQLGPLVCDLPDDHLRTETLVPAVLSSEVAGEYALRYEWRAAVLRRQGAVERAITHAGHFLPVAHALAGGASGASPLAST